MNGIRDVRCPSCGYMAEDVRCDNDAMPPCPECGTVLVTSWHSGQAPGMETFLVFKPLQVQGVTLRSKAEAAAFVAKANRRLGKLVDGPIVLDSASRAENKRLAEEARHENYVNLRNHGLSPQDVQARREEVAVKKQEKPDART